MTLHTNIWCVCVLFLINADSTSITRRQYLQRHDSVSCNSTDAAPRLLTDICHQR